MDIFKFIAKAYGVQIIKCADLDEADAKAKEVLEVFFEDKVNIKVI